MYHGGEVDGEPVADGSILFAASRTISMEWPSCQIFTSKSPMSRNTHSGMTATRWDLGEETRLLILYSELKLTDGDGVSSTQKVEKENWRKKQVCTNKSAA